jgi:hypothetical protein
LKLGDSEAAAAVVVEPEVALERVAPEPAAWLLPLVGPEAAVA